MRLRNLLAATAVSALAIGAVGVPAHSVTAPPAANAGALVTWGDEGETNPNPGAIPIPEDLAGPVRAVATNSSATGVVTLDGAVRVWGGNPGNPDAPVPAEVAGAPTGVTDGAAITLGLASGALLHTDGRVEAWGNFAMLNNVPSDLRAKAISTLVSTGYAVRTDGTLATWGIPPFNATPEGLTGLVDVVATFTHVLVLKENGTVQSWNPTGEAGPLDVPDFGGKKVVQIAATGSVSGVVFEDGTIQIWGDPSAIPAEAPTFDGLTPATKVTSLVLDSGTAAAVTADGAVHAWGSDTAVKALPESLAGQPVSAVSVSTGHAAAVITAFRDLTKPTIAGKPQVGQTLTATPATFSLAPDAPATGQWYAGNDAIPGQTSTALALTAAQVGKTISYRTTATRSDQTVTSASSTLGPVTKVTVPPVPKAKSKVTAKVKATGKTKKIAKKVKITVTVKTTKGVSPAGKVSITLKGKSKAKFNVKVNAKGVVTVTAKKIKRGKYTVSLSYAGNNRVASSKATTKLKI
jgi:hypothetical protein